MERPGAPKDRDPVHEVAPLPTASRLHYSPFLFLEDVLPWRVQRSFLGDREGTEKVHGRGARKWGAAQPHTPRRRPAPCGRLGLVVEHSRTTTKSLVFQTGPVGLRRTGPSCGPRPSASREPCRARAPSHRPVASLHPSASQLSQPLLRIGGHCFLILFFFFSGAFHFL